MKIYEGIVYSITHKCTNNTYNTIVSLEVTLFHHIIQYICSASLPGHITEKEFGNALNVDLPSNWFSHSLRHLGMI